MTLHSFLRGAVTSCVAVRSFIACFNISVFVVTCGNPCAGALSCAVLRRALSDCARTRHFGRYVHTQGRGAGRKYATFGSSSMVFFFWDTMWCFAVAVGEAVGAVTRSPETCHVVVLASSVRVVCFCSLRLSACRAWPTLNMKHKFAHIFVC